MFNLLHTVRKLYLPTCITYKLYDTLLVSLVSYGSEILKAL